MGEGLKGLAGKTNYQPDNRQAMDFLPGLLCLSSTLFLSIFASPSPELNGGGLTMRIETFKAV